MKNVSVDCEPEKIHEICFDNPIIPGGDIASLHVQASIFSFLESLRLTALYNQGAGIMTDPEFFSKSHQHGEFARLGNGILHPNDGINDRHVGGSDLHAVIDEYEIVHEIPGILPVKIYFQRIMHGNHYWLIILCRPIKIPVV